MQAQPQSTQKTVEVLALSRDQVPVVFSSNGNMRAFSKYYQAAMKEVKGAPLAADPAKAIKRARDADAWAAGLDFAA